MASPISSEAAKVYRAGGRRWLTLDAACRAAAKATVAERYPRERDGAGQWDELPIERWARMVRTLAYFHRQAYRRQALAQGQTGDGP